MLALLLRHHLLRRRAAVHVAQRAHEAGRRRHVARLSLERHRRRPRPLKPRRRRGPRAGDVGPLHLSRAHRGPALHSVPRLLVRRGLLQLQHRGGLVVRHGVHVLRRRGLLWPLRLLRRARPLPMRLQGLRRLRPLRLRRRRLRPLRRRRRPLRRVGGRLVRRCSRGRLHLRRVRLHRRRRLREDVAHHVVERLLLVRRLQARERLRELRHLLDELVGGLGSRVVPRHVARHVQRRLERRRGRQVRRIVEAAGSAHPPASVGARLRAVLRPLQLEQLRNVVHRALPPVGRELVQHRKQLVRRGRWVEASSGVSCRRRLPQPRPLRERVSSCLASEHRTVRLGA